MALLRPAIWGLRQDSRILKIPPYLSLLLILVGIGWLLVLPLNDYSRYTYISESALLPEQVSTYFGGSEHTIFRAYRHEVAALQDDTGAEVAQRLEGMFKAQGLKAARQKYAYNTAGRTISGENVYSILRGPRADATEAVVLMAAWRNMDNILNQSGVALLLTMARYFNRWSIWSKDIIFVVTEDSIAGPQAWVDAYHDTHSSETIESLSIKGGALQGALCLDYPAGPSGHRYDKLHVIYEGINGQLPNLDLFNTVVLIATGRIGVDCAIQRMWGHGDSYADRLETIFRGMLTQGLGHASGPHSSFIPYHVDAVTLQTVGDGWHDEMDLGRVVESTFRSLNNLLEHLHQSFFFYLLIGAKRFVSIGTYLPSAMLVAVNFAISSIALWVRSGKSTIQTAKIASTMSTKESEKPEMELIEHNGMVALIPKDQLTTEERHLLLPLMFIGGSHLLGLIPFYLFNHVSEENLFSLLERTFLISALAPYPTAILLSTVLPSSRKGTRNRSLLVISSLSLLLLSAALATLSTINFSLGLLIGLLATPLSFVRHLPSRPGFVRVLTFLLNFVGPPAVLLLGSLLWLQFGADPSRSTWVGMEELAHYTTKLLVRASDAWIVEGTWTAVVLWLVWWPAWFIGAVVLASSIYVEEENDA